MAQMKDISPNFRKQEVPFSRFGTRKIVWFRIGHVDDKDAGSMDMAALNTVIEAIQTKGEIVTIGAPYINDNYGKFIVGLFEDTLNNGADTDPGQHYFNSKSETLQAAIRSAYAGGGFRQSTYGAPEVQEIYMYGAPWQNATDNDGWSSDNDYREYDRKSDFLNGYTQP
jgi:hypothetical protein